MAAMERRMVDFASFGHASNDEIRSMIRIQRWGPYGYKPSLVGSIIFTVVYGICAVILTPQSLRRSPSGKRHWWMLGTLAFGSLCESTGNAVRIYGHFKPEVVDPYIAQQVILVLTPALFAAAHFTILTKVCQMYGEKYLHPLRSKWLIPGFVSLDIASLIVQGVGSGLAAVAETDGKKISTINGYGEIVVAGLCVQLVGYMVFTFLFVMVGLRVYYDKEGDTAWFDKRMQHFLTATLASALLVLARSAFRTAELGVGWIGEMSTTEWYYLVFDATFVALAVMIMCVYSPPNYVTPDGTRMDAGVAREKTSIEGSEEQASAEGPEASHDKPSNAA